MGVTITVTCRDCGKTGKAVHDNTRNRWLLPGWLFLSPGFHICRKCKGKYLRDITKGENDADS